MALRVPALSIEEFGCLVSSAFHDADDDLALRQPSRSRSHSSPSVAGNSAPVLAPISLGSDFAFAFERPRRVSRVESGNGSVVSMHLYDEYTSRV